MGLVEREMERAVHVWLWTSQNLEKPFLRDEPPSSFLVFLYLESFDSHRPHAGIFVLPFIGDEIL
jgi:hypothetical protein